MVEKKLGDKNEEYNFHYISGVSLKGHNPVIHCFLLVCFIAQPSPGRIGSLPF